MTPCPNGCGSLAEVAYEGVDIDVCQVCRGVWLDYGELSHIVETRDRSWPAEKVARVLERLARFNAPPMPEERALNCPRCQGDLDEVNYQGTSNIVVNPCRDLCGVWLDGGELMAVQVFMEHWRDYAVAHQDKIGGTLAEISAAYDLVLKKRYVEDGPSRSELVNRLVFETLEMLDKQ
ncbi:MAG: zf-TFIIB domain-containing protein [Pseudomonadota bacterium]